VFVDMCYDAYPIVNDEELFTNMKKRVSGNEIVLTLRRVLGTFTELEEFEKCSEIKNFLDKEYPGNSEPIFDYHKFIR
jgi:hypothetical protein